MARGAFSNEDVKKKLQESFYIPVIVDGDTEKKVLEKYGVRGYPTVAFVDSKGKEYAKFSGAQPAATVMGSAASAAKEMGPLRLSKSYIKIVKARAKLDKAVAKKKHKDAIKAILAIEEVGHKGSDLAYAHTVKKDLTERAQKMLDEAKALMEEKPAKAKSKLKKIAKDFKGLEVAEEAQRLMTEIG